MTKNWTSSWRWHEQWHRGGKHDRCTCRTAPFLQTRIPQKPTESNAFRCLTIRVLTSIMEIRKGAVRTMVSFLFRCHDLQEKMTAGVWSLRAVISFLLLYVVRNPRLTICVLTSIIKIRKGVVHTMVSSKLTMKARSAKTSARVMWHPPFTWCASGGKLQKAPSHAHHKKKWPPPLEAVGGHFFLSLLPLSCEIRHAMSKVTCTTWTNSTSRLTMKARSAKTSARVMWYPPFTRWASGGKLQKVPSHAHFVPKNDVAKPGGA